MPDPGRRLRRAVLAAPALTALALMALAGCSADPATPVAPAPSGAVSSPAPSSASPSSSAGPSSSGASSATPSPTPSAAESETYANDLAVADDGAISFTPLRWYQGKRAEDRCRTVGISSPTAWCHDYYYEKAGSPTRASLTADAAIKLLDDDAKLKTASAAQFRQAVQDEAWPNFRLWLVGDQIERVEQVYTP